MTQIYRDEDTAVAALVTCKRQAERMRDAFRQQGLDADGDNWSAVVGLLVAATHRFEGDEA